MECPRCGCPLERYTLDDRSTVICSECGYAGVSVDHHGERHTVETWREALSRIPEAVGIDSVTVETATEDPSLEIVFELAAGEHESAPEPTIVRVEQPDPELTAALEAAEGDRERFVCDVCGQTFDRRAQLYGHLAVHS